MIVRQGVDFKIELKRFRKLCERNDIVKEVQEHTYYQKPSEKKNKRNRMVKRMHKFEMENNNK